MLSPESSVITSDAVINLNLKGSKLEVWVRGGSAWLANCLARSLPTVVKRIGNFQRIRHLPTITLVVTVDIDLGSSCL